MQVGSIQNAALGVVRLPKSKASRTEMLATLGAFHDAPSSSARRNLRQQTLRLHQVLSHRQQARSKPSPQPFRIPAAPRSDPLYELLQRLVLLGARDGVHAHHTCRPVSVQPQKILSAADVEHTWLHPTRRLA